MHRIAAILPSDNRPSGIRVKRGLGNFWVTLAAVAAAIAPASGQTKRCDLVGRDTTASGVPGKFKRCLDLSSLQNSVVTVPGNVTRIDNDGLSLCKGSLRLGGDADIVFVLDQSGSMAANHAWINTSVTPNDTIFYHGRGGCSNNSSAGTLTYNVFETTHGSPATPKTRTVNLLVNGAGCRDWAGDPYNIRALAVRQAIDSMAKGSLISTAGYLGFAGSPRTASMVSPLQVGSAANVTTLKNNIFIEFEDGTNYTGGLRQAKTWLNDPTKIKTTKQAIVFVSDGAPNPADSNGVALTSDGKMPPIYSIFLARATTSDTAKMKTLSDNTAGQFFRVPPQKPDSLVSIVKKILNLILKEYQPQNAVVTNNSLAPTQSASATMPGGFQLQGDGSWLMKLSDIIALNRNADNEISVRTHFKETGGPAVDSQTINFKLSTKGGDATADTTKIPGNPFEWVCYDKSKLAILNAAGQRLNYFTDTNKVVRVRLRTAEMALDSATYPERTALKGDQESFLRKALIPPFKDSVVFDGSNPFEVKAAARTNGNGILESSLFDSIIVSWVHPRDAQDVVTDIMPVRAGMKPATAHFSRTDGGVPTAMYPITSTRAYIVVTDQAADPRKTYTAVVTSSNFSLDRETITLTETSPGSGILIGSIPFDQLAGKLQGDGKLEVAVTGDQLKVVYKDPVDGDSAIGNAGFEQLVQEVPDLVFTDAAGVPLPIGTVWSPANGKLFVTYSDDFFGGAIGSKKAILALASRKFGTTLATDDEPVTVTLVPGSTGPTRASWTGSIDLLDLYPPVDSNGKAETRFRGEATLSIRTHDNKGIADAAPITASLLIAYPDSVATLGWRMDTTVASNEGLIITVNDQTYTPTVRDTALVSVACLRSGDSVASFAAQETGAATGAYLSGTLVKDEGTPNLADRVLSCLATDVIRIRYVDPVFGTTAELIVEETGKPVAVPPGRKFVTGETVEITSATPGAKIYYTLDGTKPIPGVSPLYSDAIRVTQTTTIKAIAIRNGFKDSKIMTETYTKESVASRLEILDENGNAIPGGTLTTSATMFRIKLVTSQEGLPFADPILMSRVAGDSERVILGNFGSLGSGFEYWEAIRFSAPSPKSPADDTVQSAGTDTVIATWTNPFNSADKASATLFIKPAFVAADVYFSSSNNGPRITEYPVGQDTVFIVVKTRPKDPAFTYQVVLTSSDLPGDREEVPLTEVSPGVFTGKLKVGTGVKAKGDDVIQVAASGDQLTAVFTDPVYKIDYQGDAGFAQQVQEAAAIDFIDENGALLSPADVWSPAKGNVYLRYTDDWNASIEAGILTKAVRFALINLKSGVQVGTDAETANITLKSHTATRGTWEGSLTLADKTPAVNNNGTLEAYYRGELKASITPHNNAGTPAGTDLSDSLVIAYPNQPAEIVIRDDNTDSAVVRKTDKVEIIVRDQQVTKSGDATLVVEVTCSTDKVSQVTLVWDGTQYVSKPPLDKGEITSGIADKGDGKLMCRDTDVLTVTYKDPVYNDIRTADAGWSDDTKPDMWYESTKDGSRITSAADAATGEFRIVIQGKSPTRDQADIIEVVLTTAQGEREKFNAVETGAFTGLFHVTVPFKFRNAEPAKDNGTVDAKIVTGNRVNQVIATGEASIGGSPVKADISLLSSYDLVSKAWMKDEDGDGRADHAYFLFDHKLDRLPTGLTEANWNEDGASFRKAASAGQLSFVAGTDSTLVVADFSKDEFGANLTGVPESKQLPTATFPDDNLFGAQKASLQDSVGPVPVTAFKRPSNGLTYTVTETEKRFNPDTLVITVSERLRTNTSFLELLRFSKGCKDYSESVPLKLSGQPEFSSDGLTITVIVDNSLETQTPFVEDCIFLETDGRYADFLTNRPSPLGVPLKGTDPRLIIRAFRGYPPVAGIDAGSNGFTVSNHDPLANGSDYRKAVGADQQIEVIWVPPVGYDPADPVGSLDKIARDFNNPQTGERAGEVTYPRAMPIDISTIQVITSTAYLAKITIYDNLGHFVRSMTQSFGRNGELRNKLRTVEGGQVSFLVWDMKDDKGFKVGQGVFVWKVAFTFTEKNKKSEVRYTRTGVLRQK